MSHPTCPKCNRYPHACLCAEVEKATAELRAEVERLHALLDRAWDVLPEGYTVLRGEILTSLGRPGCTDCGYDCTENPWNPCTAQRDDRRGAN